MNNSRLSELLDKYLSNSITDSEKDQLLLMIRSNSYLPELERIVDQQLLSDEFDQEQKDELRELIFEKIKRRISGSLGTNRARIAYLTWSRVAVAAAILIFFIVGYVLFTNQKKDKPLAQHHEQSIKNDVQPGKYRAKLTLANGQIIIISDSTSRELARQGNVTVVNAGNQLIYQTKRNTATGVLYNTLSTGRGETYSMVLSDGSKVWLNSLSSLRFPVTFTGDERKVEVSGEAYFQIKHNARMPFKLVANGVEVQDLGTEFNVNDYDDEPAIKTTLVSGRAKVIKGNKNHLLEPGQEVQVKQDELIFISNADIEQATAWKDGLFRFRSTDLEAVMRQIARWYNVDVGYEDKIPDAHFTGIVSRGVTLAEVLKMLDLNGIHVRLNGTKLTVIP